MTQSPPRGRGRGSSSMRWYFSREREQGPFSTVLSLCPHLPDGPRQRDVPTWDTSWCQGCPCPVLLLPPRHSPGFFWQLTQTEPMILEAGWHRHRDDVPTCKGQPCITLHASPRHLCGHPMAVLGPPSSGMGWWWPRCPAWVPVPTHHRAPPAPWGSHAGWSHVLTVTGSSSPSALAMGSASPGVPARQASLTGALQALLPSSLGFLLLFGGSLPPPPTPAPSCPQGTGDSSYSFPLRAIHFFLGY